MPFKGNEVLLRPRLLEHAQASPRRPLTFEHLKETCFALSGSFQQLDSSCSRRYIIRVCITYTIGSHLDRNTQTYASPLTHCLGLFVNNPIYLEDIILRTRILRLIERQVNDRVRRYLLINLRLFSPFPSPPQFVLRIFRISGPYLVNCLRARASTRLTQIRTFIGTSFRFSTHWFAYAEILSSLRFLIWASCYDVSLFLSSHFHHNLEGSKRDSWLVHYLAGSTRHTHWAWKKARQLRGCLLPLPPRLSYEPMGHQNFRRLNPLHGHSLNMHLRF